MAAKKSKNQNREGYYEIEEVFDVRHEDRRIEFHVVWEGYAETQWLLIDDFPDKMKHTMIKAFLKKPENRAKFDAEVKKRNKAIEKYGPRDEPKEKVYEIRTIKQVRCKKIVEFKVVWVDGGSEAWLPLSNFPGGLDNLRIVEFFQDDANKRLYEQAKLEEERLAMEPKAPETKKPKATKKKTPKAKGVKKMIAEEEVKKEIKEEEDDDRYEIVEVRTIRKEGGLLMVELKWESTDEYSWEPIENVGEDNYYFLEFLKNRENRKLYDSLRKEINEEQAIQRKRGRPRKCEQQNVQPLSPASKRTRDTIQLEEDKEEESRPISTSSSQGPKKRRTMTERLQEDSRLNWPKAKSGQRGGRRSLATKDIGIVDPYWSRSRDTSSLDDVNFLVPHVDASTTTMAVPQNVPVDVPSPEHVPAPHSQDELSFIYYTSQNVNMEDMDGPETSSNFEAQAEALPDPSPLEAASSDEVVASDDAPDSRIDGHAAPAQDQDLEAPARFDDDAQRKADSEGSSQGPSENGQEVGDVEEIQQDTDPLNDHTEAMIRGSFDEEERAGNWAKVEELIENGAPMHWKLPNGNSLMYAALRKNATSCAILMMKKGADPVAMEAGQMRGPVFEVYVDLRNQLIRAVDNAINSIAREQAILYRYPLRSFSSLEKWFHGDHQEIRFAEMDFMDEVPHEFGFFVMKARYDEVNKNFEVSSDVPPLQLRFNSEKLERADKRFKSPGNIYIVPKPLTNDFNKLTLRITRSLGNWFIAIRPISFSPPRLPKS